MNATPSRRAFLAFLGLAGVAAGCSLKRPALQPRTFVLSAPPNVPPSDVAGPAGVLWVRPVRVAATFDSQAFIVRRGESEYVADPYHRFLVSPGPMFTELVAAWIQKSGLFHLVITGGSQVPPSHALEIEVTDCVADYRDRSAPAAVLAITARLLHPLSGPPAQQLRWQHAYRSAIPIAKPDSEALVAGWNRALAEVLSGLGAELRSRPVPIGAPRA